MNDCETNILRLLIERPRRSIDIHRAKCLWDQRPDDIDIALMEMECNDFICHDVTFGQPPTYQITSAGRLRYAECGRGSASES